MAINIKISTNRYSVNIQRIVFCEGWPKPLSVNPQFGQSGADKNFKKSLQQFLVKKLCFSKLPPKPAIVLAPFVRYFVAKNF